MKKLCPQCGNRLPDTCCNCGCNIENLPKGLEPCKMCGDYPVFRTHNTKSVDPHDPGTTYQSYTINCEKCGIVVKYDHGTTTMNQGIEKWNKLMEISNPKIYSNNKERKTE